MQKPGDFVHKPAQDTSERKSKYLKHGTAAKQKHGVPGTQRLLTHSAAIQKTKESSIDATSCEPVQKKPSPVGGISANWIKLQQELGLATKKRAGLHDGTYEQSPNNVKKPKIWFDDVEEELLEKEACTSDITQHVKQNRAHEKLAKANADTGLTAAVAMDCEMVGVGYEGKESILARVSIVNQFGQCVYDSFVKPTEEVTDYRTAVSGVRPEDMKNGKEFDEVQKAVSDILKGRVLVGHAVHNDLKVLFLDHPRKKIRDTSSYKPFRALFSGRKPSLKKLTAKVLSVQVQDGEHDSVQDAQAAMRLYTMFRTRWEKDIKMAARGRGQPKATEAAAGTKAEKEYTTEYLELPQPGPSNSRKQKISN